MIQHLDNAGEHPGLKAWLNIDNSVAQTVALTFVKWGRIYRWTFVW